MEVRMMFNERPDFSFDNNEAGPSGAGPVLARSVSVYFPSEWVQGPHAPTTSGTD
jgi:hypothetical protein